MCKEGYKGRRLWVLTEKSDGWVKPAHINLGEVKQLHERCVYTLEDDMKSHWPTPDDPTYKQLIEKSRERLPIRVVQEVVRAVEAPNFHHLEKSQRAMAAAIVSTHLKARKQKGAGRATERAAKVLRVGSQLVDRSLMMLRHHPDYALRVLAGEFTLQTAKRQICQTRDRRFGWASRKRGESTTLRRSEEGAVQELAQLDERVKEAEELLSKVTIALVELQVLDGNEFDCKFDEVLALVGLK